MICLLSLTCLYILDGIVGRQTDLLIAVFAGGLGLGLCDASVSIHRFGPPGRRVGLVGVGGGNAISGSFTGRGSRRRWGFTARHLHDVFSNIVSRDFPDDDVDDTADGAPQTAE